MLRHLKSRKRKEQKRLGKRKEDIQEREIIRKSK